MLICRDGICAIMTCGPGQRSCSGGPSWLQSQLNNGPKRVLDRGQKVAHSQAKGKHASQGQVSARYWLKTREASLISDPN